MLIQGGACPKRKRIVDKKFLKSLKSKTCLTCGSIPPSDPSHMTSVGAGGDDTKENVIPQCRRCHQEWGMGRFSFLEKNIKLVRWLEYQARWDILNLYKIWQDEKNKPK